MDPVATRRQPQQGDSASTAAIYAAISDLTRMARWWVPRGSRTRFTTSSSALGTAGWATHAQAPTGRTTSNQSRFARIVPERLVEIEHLSGHHFVLTIELMERDAGTLAYGSRSSTRQAHRNAAGNVAPANEQNLETPGCRSAAGAVRRPCRFINEGESREQTLRPSRQGQRRRECRWQEAAHHRRRRHRSLRGVSCALGPGSAWPVSCTATAAT